MKKIALFLTAALLLSCCFAFAACSSDKPSDSSSNTSSAQTASSQETSSNESSEPAASSQDASSADTSSEESSSTPEPETHTFFLSHYNDGLAEGAGSIFTTTDTAGAWWAHVALKPVDGSENVYEIVQISNGIAGGTATPIEIPEGGFVYAINVGNDWPSIVAQDPAAWPGQANEPNYTSDNCNTMVGLVNLWNIGDKLLIQGLDLETLVVPTETPDLKWYEPGYVCTATWQYAE